MKSLALSALVLAGGLALAGCHTGYGYKAHPTPPSTQGPSGGYTAPSQPYSQPTPQAQPTPTPSAPSGGGGACGAGGKACGK